MSRQIIIQAQYMNNIIAQRGIYNPTNMEWKKSKLSLADLIHAFENFKKDTEGKKIKNLKILHYVSGSTKGDSRELIMPINDIRDVDLVTQINVNNAMYKAFL